jgi:hypothetical protein
MSETGEFGAGTWVYLLRERPNLAYVCLVIVEKA